MPSRAIILEYSKWELLGNCLQRFRDDLMVSGTSKVASLESLPSPKWGGGLFWLQVLPGLWPLPYKSHQLCPVLETSQDWWYLSTLTWKDPDWWAWGKGQLSFGTQDRNEKNLETLFRGDCVEGLCRGCMGFWARCSGAMWCLEEAHEGLLEHQGLAGGSLDALFLFGYFLKDSYTYAIYPDPISTPVLPAPFPSYLICFMSSF